MLMAYFTSGNDGTNERAVGIQAAAAALEHSSRSHLFRKHFPHVRYPVIRYVAHTLMIDAAQAERRYLIDLLRVSRSLIVPLADADDSCRRRRLHKHARLASTSVLFIYAAARRHAQRLLPNVTNAHQRLSLCALVFFLSNQR